MRKRVTVLGSTGSIGTKSLEVMDSLSDEFVVQGLSANRNVALLCQQAKRYRPDRVAIMQEGAVPELARGLEGLGIEVFGGLDGLNALAEDPRGDVLLNALVGAVGLLPSLRAIECGKDIALANKEALVMGGELVVEAVCKHKVRLIPVDSEHSAIFQCLQGSRPQEIRRLILTASGGPFWGCSRAELEDIAPSRALAHPTWDMGRKITVDSATLMNKGLEVIEAHWLFDVSPAQIEVVIHPESIVHSMVEFVDGSIVAQLSQPDMRLPIQYALTYPQRVACNGPGLNLGEQGQLTFAKPNLDRFPCLGLAYRALEQGGTMPAALSAANEVVVEAFLAQQLGFLDIAAINAQTMDAHETVSSPTLDDVLGADQWARDEARSLISHLARRK